MMCQEKREGSLISSLENSISLPILFYGLGFLLANKVLFFVCLCHVNAPVEVAQSTLGELLLKCFLLQQENIKKKT